MKLNVGDKVRVKSLEWYNKNEKDGVVNSKKGPHFNKLMSDYCGKETTIKRIAVQAYVLDIDKLFYFAEDSVEPIMQDNSLNVLKGCTLTTNCITLQDGQTAKICVDNGQTKIMIENKEVKKEEPNFKKGDILFLNAQGDNKIYKHIIITKSIYGNRHYFYADFCINDNELCSEYESMWFSKENIKSIRFATEEEKRTLFIAMLNKGMFWDENKMKVRMMKDGDIITTKVDNGTDWYSIFKEIKDGEVCSYYDLNDYGYFYNEVGPLSYINNIISICYSTTEERQTLFDNIEEKEHKKWNTVTKEFENVEWIAKKGEEYWYVSSCFNVYKRVEYKGIVDNGLAYVKNKFRTKELAEAAANKIKELLSKL